jgi:hypothetical protein
MHLSNMWINLIWISGGRGPVLTAWIQEDTNTQEPYLKYWQHGAMDTNHQDWTLAYPPLW